MQEIHYEHPTPEEWVLIANEIDSVRNLLVEVRSRLFWASRGLTPDDPNRMRPSHAIELRAVQERWTDDVGAALTPLIAYLHDAGPTIQGWADAKRAALPEWKASPSHRVEPGWPDGGRV